jgi:membrane protein DedA with SNARE-associated domain
MFAAGLLQVPWRRFIVPEVIAVVLWVGYDVMVPVLLGPGLPGWATVLLSLAVAAVLAGLAELARRVVERRRTRTGA